MVRIAALALIVSSVLCATASAAKPHKAFASGPSLSVKVSLSVAVARYAWPDSPCRGRENLTVSSTRPAEADDQHTAGVAWPDSCRVWVEAGMDTVTTCDTMVHEFGHLALQTTEHTYAGNRGIMLPDGHFPACQRLGMLLREV